MVKGSPDKSNDNNSSKPAGEATTSSVGAPPTKEKKLKRISSSKSRKRASPASLGPLVETEATIEALPAIISNWDAENALGEASIFMNGGGNYTTVTTTTNSSSHSLPANSFHDSSGSFNSLATMSAHNSEPFSLDEGCSLLEEDGLLSASEASSILERHIASHPIETEDDFHYIADLLKNYEDEDDLKRVAELIRDKKKKKKSAAIPKKKEKKKNKTNKKASEVVSKKKTGGKPPIRSLPRNHKYEPPPSDDGEIMANDDDEDEDEDVDHGGGGDSSSESSESSSVSSIPSSSSSESGVSRRTINYNGDEHSSLTSSVRKVKKRKKETAKDKERKRKKREKERLRKQLERKGEKDRKAKKKDKKEEKKKKEKERKRAEKKKRNKEADEYESALVPPTSIEVVKAVKAVKAKDKDEHDMDSTQHSRNAVRQADKLAAIQPQPQSRSHPPPQPQDVESIKANDDDDEDDSGGALRETFQDEPSQSTPESSTNNAAREIFLNEPLVGPQSAPATIPIGPESFPYPGMIQRNNSLSIKGSMTSNVPETTSVTESAPQHDESTSSFDPSFPYPGGILTTNKGSNVSVSMEDITETEFEESFPQTTTDPAHGQGTGVPFPPLPENEVLPPTALSREVSGAVKTSSVHSAPDHRLSLTKNSENTSLRLSSLAGSNRLSSMGSMGKSNSDSFQDSWAQAPDSSSEVRSTSRAPPMPTILSSSVSGSSVPKIKMDSIKEFQEGLGEPNSESTSESTPDEEMVTMALRHFSNGEIKVDEDDLEEVELGEGARISSAYPPLGNFHFSRQVSTDYAKSTAPLPTSKLNASLILNRQTSSDLLKTTLDMQRQRSGDSLMGISPSVLRPPAERRGDSGVVSTTDMAKLRETMVRGSSSDFMRPGSSALMSSSDFMRPGSSALISSDFSQRPSSMLMTGIPEPPDEVPQATINIRQQSIPDEVTGEMIQAEFSVKPRLLCLHGWRSNAEITRLQLDNLGLLDFFDPIFIEGPHISDKPADDAVNLLSQGPYYSWVEKTSAFSDTDAGGGKISPENRHNSLKSLRQSIYSFGRSGTAGSGKRNNGPTATDELMLSLKAVMMHLLTESQYLDAFVHENEEIATIPCYDAVYGFSQGATLITLLSYEFVRNRVLEELNLPPMQRLPWRFVISACAANTNMKELLAHHFELEYSVQIPLPSVHIIGLSDSRKGQSEAIMKDHYNSQQVFPIYLDSGHGIPASTRKLSYVLDEIINWFLLKITLPDVDIANVPLEAQSQSVSMLHIMDEIDKIQRDQLEDYPSTDTDLDVGQLHLGAYGQYIINTVQSSHSNLIEMLEDADPKKIAFLAPEAKPLTYGGFLKFIRSDGDLRKAGAQEGFTVAYVAPFGVVSATAFITIAAQCSAAPLDPGYNEADYLLAFEQLRPDIVITFDGVDTALVHKVALGQGLRVAHATVDPDTCGLFKFERDKNGSIANLSSFLDDDRRIVNHADNNGLILRTSGTTSKPKIVPLKLWAIVANSRVIAKSLGLRSSDIALNAMPLFHIGGLSANLLSSLAAGGSVILMPKFNAADFFDFLTSPEEPRPTWYSAVPTMHAAIHQFSEDSIFKTSLRFIRSGAAAMPHDLAVKMEKTFDCPLILTYSMTEQMPISQPPRGYSIARNKPNSVGQPVCASMCIVDKNMRPVPFFAEQEGEDGLKEPINGEVCISGPMIVEGYLANPDANANSFFRMGGMDWFRTGDMGHLDKEGFLFLTGRSKELIKRGGDQVSPYEVEDAIYKHLDVKTVVVFAIPDPIWGERVGAAIILKDGVHHQQAEFKKELSKMLVDDGLQPFKVPEEVLLVKEEDLPKTRSNKYIRIGLAKALGLDSKKERDQLNAMKPVNYHEAAVGVKFFLAYAVTYVHIGNFDNRDLDEYAHAADYHYQWEHTRSWCWHNPIFFLVGGFLLAAGTHVPVTNLKDLANFYSLRIAGLHPMYLISILFCTANFIARCHPTNYIPEFDRAREPKPGEYFVCQATPIEWPYIPTLFISVLSYACTLQSWPVMIPFSWFLSYYTWFSSVYIFCIFVFPWCHQQYHAVRDDIDKIWKLTFFWLGMNYLYVAGISILFAMDDEALKNYFGISSYLFPPGWFPCCACGVGCFYLFRHYRPNERGNSWIWGATTDVISLLLLAGWLFYGLAPEVSSPDFIAGDGAALRHWDPFLSRILAPFGFLWFWGLAVGTGYTSSLFSIPFVVEWLAPASYNMFLFHQPVAEWYYLATRGVWWAYPKKFFWFSPHPYPVAFWEFFIVTAIVVAFSVFMEAYFNELLVANFAAVLSWIGGGGLERKSKEGESVFQVVQSIIHELTYADVTMETGLTEAGLSSMTTIILVSEIKKVYKTLKLTVRDVINSESVGELVEVIEGRMKESAARPELALGKRTAVVASKTMRKMLGDSMQDYSDGNGEDAINNNNNTNNNTTTTTTKERPRLIPPGVSTRMMMSSLSIMDDGPQKRGSGKARRKSSRSRRASFVLDSAASTGSGSASRRHGSIQITPAPPAPVSRSTSRNGRMSFTIHTGHSNTLRAPRSTASRPSNRSSASSISSRSTAMGRRPTQATISTAGFSRRSTARPKRMSRMVKP